MQLLSITADIKTQPVPYKGTGPLMPDMLSGRIDFTFNNLKTLMPMIKAGKLLRLTTDK